MNGGAGEGFISEEPPGIRIVLASISYFNHSSIRIPYATN
jgi:hypothetical protein